MEQERAGNGKKLWVLVWMIVGIVLVLGAVWVMPDILKSHHQRPEIAAVSNLRSLNGMMETFRKWGFAEPGRVYPWGIGGPSTNRGKYCALYYAVNSALERVTLIGAADANADCRGDGDTDANLDQGCYITSIRTTGPPGSFTKPTFTCSPKQGYWFGLCMYKGTMPYNLTNAKSHFGLVGFPDDYGSSGETTFIINEDGEVYTLDRGKDGKYLGTFPADPIKEGWDLAK